MGFGGISMWQLLIILVIVVLIFGTKRIRTIGGDLGGALKSFRKAMDSGDDKDGDEPGPKRIEDGKPDAEFAEQKDKSQSS
jgi:sec-independent protein translocase protein TatA